jgi:hypothetical protein
VDWSRLQLSVLRGLGLSVLVVLFLTGRSYFSHGKERVNQEWHERAKDFLGLTIIVTWDRSGIQSQFRSFGRSHPSAGIDGGVSLAGALLTPS